MIAKPEIFISKMLTINSLHLNQLDLKDLNITYLDYHSRKSETNTDLYDADFAYRSNDHEDILVGFRAIDLTESAISKYDKFESLPKNITSIRVYSSLENEK
ncbi:hypothetical protein [Psychrobacter immobilis]|uniref:hypothetical protein n=1 Tax=Psychrobacter immobilis TaxID=498 RepID=UPI001918668D|nr:hypothetical protein [Psychrobacter immobilis]